MATMEETAPEKSVSFFSVRNTYKYVENYVEHRRGRDPTTKPRHSVDLEWMFFGGQNGGNADTNDTESNFSATNSTDTLGGHRDETDAKSVEGKAQSEASSGDRRSSSGFRSSAGLERTALGTPAYSDQMARFYARLQELRETKEEDEKETTNSEDAVNRKKERKRIKTALRRLLTERLFPEEATTKRSKTASAKESLPDGDKHDVLYSGTITPMTVGSRAKSVRSRQGEDGESTRATTRTGTGSKVVFVGNQSHTTSSDTDGNRLNYPDSNSRGAEEEEETVPYYRRHPLGPLKQGQVSRLYRPTMTARSRTTMSQGSLHLDGLRRDRAFLERMGGKRGTAAETRWSVSGERGPEFTSRSSGESNTNSDTRGVWRRDRVSVPWAYNLRASAPSSQQKATTEFVTPKGQIKLKNIDDWELRKLLEELYRDQKYMDKLIQTTEHDKTEDEVRAKLESGRDYLLERAVYWLEKGPLPPRPPTTELGYRLQRAQTAALLKTEPSSNSSQAYDWKSSEQEHESSEQLSADGHENGPPTKDVHSEKSQTQLQKQQQQQQQPKQQSHNDPRNHSQQDQMGLEKESETPKKIPGGPVSDLDPKSGDAAAEDKS